jgi:hypothetical protein
MRPPVIKKLVSGGQAGVDRGSLDAAILLGIPHGGWCPQHRRAEDGPISGDYKLQSTQSSDYRVRTRRNVLHSDGTLIFCSGPPSGGTRLTRDWAICLARPCHLVDFSILQQSDQNSDEAYKAMRVAEQSVCRWLHLNGIEVLNVAGPRASRHAWIAESTCQFLCNVFTNR